MGCGLWRDCAVHLCLDLCHWLGRYRHTDTPRYALVVRRTWSTGPFQCLELDLDIHDQQCIIATLNLATRHIQCAPGDPGPPLVFIGYSSAGNELHVTLSDEEFAPLRDFVAPPLACT